MSAHQLRNTRFLVLSLAIAIVGLVSIIGSGTARAAPPGAAQNLSVYDQRCTSQGKVQVTFVWNPSGQGNQWFDVSHVSNFSGFANQGPLASNVYYTAWTLDSNVNFYARVNTFTSQGFRASDTLSLRTINCANTAFTPPHSVDAGVFSNFVRINWERGNGNLYFCVDTAFSQADLLNLQGSWRNWGCGTTATSLDLQNLACERQHYFRVWAAGNGTSGHSQVGSFVSQSCNFSSPTSPSASPRADGSVRIDWERGSNNLWFCIDLAKNQSDLTNLTGTWFNAACGTTGTTATLTNLQCGTTYYYRVWGTGSSSSGYTSVANFTTAACNFNPPNQLDEDIIDADSVNFEWNERSDALWFCVDYAGSESDLVSFGNSWRNACTGGADEELTVDDASYWDCGETYYWRVFAYSNSGSGYSETRSFTMPLCT